MRDTLVRHAEVFLEGVNSVPRNTLIFTNLKRESSVVSAFLYIPSEFAKIYSTINRSFYIR